MNWQKITKEFYDKFTIKTCGFTQAIFAHTVKPNEVLTWFKNAVQSDKRTSAQNRSLHLYFTMIAEQFNNLGWTYDYLSPFTGKTIELPWSGELVKEYIWKPIQKQLFNKDSTTKINTQEINQVIDLLSNHFAKTGIYIEFPNWQTYLNKVDSKNL